MTPDPDLPDPGAAAPSRRPRAGSHLGHMLAEGTRLHDFEIRTVIGEGGFGIVYLAWDHSLQRKVAVKEYMPAAMVSRVAGSNAIALKSDRHLETFHAGLKSFVNEARLLARFDHPALVKVYRFWEENGTAYMAMPFYEGPTLHSVLASLGRAPSEAELRRWLDPLLDALAVLHQQQVWHRDISPDNILLTPAGPLLLDFGAARRVIGDMTHALTVVLKPGYAPIEQYGEIVSMAQGAWTDLYALASVVYFAVTGRTPMSSVERLMGDRLEPLSKVAAGRYSAAFLDAIDAALAVRAQDRPQDAASFRALLDADTAREIVGVVVETAADAALPVFDARADLPAPRSYAPTQRLEPADLRAAMPARPARRRVGAAALASVLVVGGLAYGVASLRETSPPARDVPAGITAGGGAAEVSAYSLPPAIAASISPASEPVPAPLPVTDNAAQAAVTRDALPAPRTPRAASPAATAATAATATTAPATPATRASSGSPAAEPAAEAPLPPPAAARVATSIPVEPSPPAARPPPRREAAAAERGEPAPVAVGGTRCSDILLKASLEPLSAAETAFLKKECG